MNPKGIYCFFRSDPPIVGSLIFSTDAVFISGVGPIYEDDDFEGSGVGKFPDGSG